MANNSIELAKDVLTALLPSGTLVLACPPSVEAVAIKYWEDGYLFVLPDFSLLFELLDGPGRQRSQVLRVVSSIPRGTAALLVGASNQITLISKSGATSSHELRHLTFSILSDALKVPAPSKPDTTSGAASQVPIPTFLKNPSPHDAPLLAEYASRLTRNLSRSSGEQDRTRWTEVASAALKILPDAIRDSRSAGPSMEAVARSIVFLSADEKLDAMKRLLSLAVSEAITEDMSERLSSIVLAVAPSVNSEHLWNLVRATLPQVRHRGKMSPSLAQLLSLSEARLRGR